MSEHSSSVRSSTWRSEPEQTSALAAALVAARGLATRTLLISSIGSARLRSMAMPMLR